MDMMCFAWDEASVIFFQPNDYFINKKKECDESMNEMKQTHANCMCSTHARLVYESNAVCDGMASGMSEVGELCAFKLLF